MYEISAADRIATDAVSSWIAQFDFDSVPAGVKSNVNLVLLDTLGVMLASTRYEVGTSIIKGAQALSSGGDIVIPGTKLRLDMAASALVYGTLGHGIELDEVHLPSRQHVGATVGATALVLGQHYGMTLAQLRAAILIGYEVSGHLGIAVDNNVLLDKNFHLSGVVSGFGCCAAAARLLGLSAAEIYHALGLTASQASGTLAWHTESHHMSKSFQCGLGARNGLTAALLAQQGYLGPVAVFAGPCNFFLAFKGKDPDQDWFRALGTEFEILNTSMKLYAAGRPMHSALDALLAMMKLDSITTDEIESLEVRMPPGAARIVDGNHTTSVDCRSVMAAAAIDGKFGLEQADDERIGRVDVQTLKQRIRLIHDATLDPYFPHNFPATVSLRYRQGRVATETVIAATGERDNPMTADALKEKFRSLAEPVIGKKATGELIRLVLSPDNATVRELAGLLAA